MERYDTQDDDKQQYSRSNKNQTLYQNVGRNARVANFTDVTKSNAVDITNARENYNTREGYHQIKEVDDIIQPPKVKKELDEFNYLYQDHENRVYDINSVLEEARKNRVDKDDLEEKRKLKNTNYNILAFLNKDELERYRKEKQERAGKPDEEEVRSLIDTITSKTLAGEIDKATSVDLLSDLMATRVEDTVPPAEKDSGTDEEDKDTTSTDKLELSKEVLDEDQLNEVKNKGQEATTEDKIMKDADNDFYTRSMDLSDKDFTDKDEDEEEEKHIPVGVKVLLILILIAAVAAVAYFIWKSF
jgi:hypothetical protein